MTRRAAPSATIAVLVAIALAAAGCSQLFVNGPPNNHRAEDAPTCHRDSVLPYVDLVAAIATATATGFVGGRDERWDELREESGESTARGWRIGVIAAGISMTLVYLSSMGVGFRRVSKCRDAWEDHETWQRRQL